MKGKKLYISGGEFVPGIIFITAGLLIFTILSLNLYNPLLLRFDKTMTEIIANQRNPIMTALMLFITFLGSQYFLGTSIILVIFLLSRKHKKDAFNFAFILLTGILLNYLLKDIYQRARPDLLPLVFESTYSFPSGHAMNSFIFFTSLIYFIFKNVEKKKIKFISALAGGILILAIGFSRIYLGAHYPSDVAAGYAAGWAWFAMVLIFEKLMHNKTRFTKRRTSY